MRKLVFLGVLCCHLAMGLSGAAFAGGNEQRLLEAKGLLNEGVEAWDHGVMLKARMLFEECLSESEETKWLAHYYIGYADFRLSTFYGVLSNRDSQLKYLQDGIDHLRAARDSKYDFADSHALLALMAGQQARMDPSQMASLGMEAQGEIQEARQLGKDNPRVAMISGIMYFYTPGQFGGSKTKAVEEMQRSLPLFETESPDDVRLPDWGHSDSLAWLARLYVETGEFELAERRLREALKVSPRNVLALRVKSQLKERMNPPR